MMIDILVAGMGPAGLAIAAALARHSDCSIALVAPPRAVDSEDTRTAALFSGSIALLRNAGAWRDLAPLTAPLRGIRIIDDHEGRLLRAPEVTFEAGELGLEDFGANVPQEALGEALTRVVSGLPNVEIIRARATGLEILDTGALVRIDDGREMMARLVVAADGRNSVCRSLAGIEVESWDYPQTAIAAQFSHSRDHRGISTEFHRAGGPCTVVPMPGHRSSLVWVERHASAQRLQALDDHAFALALEERLQGVLGSVREVGRRRLFPLGGLKASVLGRNRVALVGEAGHTLPPIGAQGLNLGFRDVAVLAALVEEARNEQKDIGGSETLERYDRARGGDIRLRTTAVDVLNRSLLADFLPIDLARGASLHAIGSIAALKRQVMRAGFEPSGDLPPLMRETIQH